MDERHKLIALLGLDPENVDEEEEEITRGRIRKRAISSSDSSSHENEDEHLRSVVKKVVMKINKHKIVDEVMKALANEESCNSSNDNQKEHEIPVTENIQQEIITSGLHIQDPIMNFYIYPF